MTGLPKEMTQNEPNAVYGIYKDGNIVLDKPVKMASESRVIVQFLKEQPSKKTSLVNFFDDYGTWEDDRNVDTIIADIYTARHSKLDIEL
jgi:hypothetical protein